MIRKAANSTESKLNISCVIKCVRKNDDVVTQRMYIHYLRYFAKNRLFYQKTSVSFQILYYVC